MAFTPEQHKEHRKKLRERGVCTRCRINKPDKGRSVCKACYDYINRRRHKLLEQGRCRDCGGFKGDGMVRCALCAETDNLNRRIRSSL